ncbi:MAG: hypothetical protein CSA68_11735 [Rhodobacterales bacterium]|nr:MAG: hypothetical protein CSA68_11735 [Rhodobacterales bacterium]
MQILRHNALIDIPWKNGGGITRNIALGSCDGQTAWRLSRADVAEDGAFSSFTGLIRILTVVSDSGMVLQHSQGGLDADPWQPVRFSGELDVFARLKGGPLTDLNLMFDPRLCDAAVTPRRGPLDQPVTPPATGMTALHVLAGRPTFGPLQLEVGDTAFPVEQTQLKLGTGDAVLEIQVLYLDQSKPIKFVIAAR